MYKSLFAGRLRALSFLWVWLFLILATLGWAQSKETPGRTPDLEPSEGLRQGRELVNQLLAQTPEKNVTNSGVLRIRHGDNPERAIPVRIEIFTTPTNWVTRYDAAEAAGETLTVIRSAGKPSQYWLKRPGDSSARQLEGAAVMVPFAGSDFWVADLGLEFLHWPAQRVLRKELRKSLSCSVLESVAPAPVTQGYSRVLSWVDNDSGAIVHADAFDAGNQLLKQFDPTELKKVQGERQLEEMEMRNRQTRSRTWIKFNL
jgi:hypothetical protein